MRWMKYGDSMLQGIFSDKVIPDISFNNEAVVQCYVLVINLFL